MSATLEAARVAALLGDAAVESEGRAHEVTVRWSPRRPKERLDAATVAAILRAVKEEPGDRRGVPPVVQLEHGARRPYAYPEISSVDLAGLALELAVWAPTLPIWPSSTRLPRGRWMRPDHS